MSKFNTVDKTFEALQHVEALFKAIEALTTDGNDH